MASREQARRAGTPPANNPHGEGGTASPPAGSPPGPLVSVIMPTYNYGALIGETFESLRAQTCGDWECLVVDDGSTDDTAAVVDRYAARDPRFKYFRQRNQLQAAAKNLGLEHSAGRYVQFLDADDLIEARKLERQSRYLEEHPEVDIVYGGVRYFSTGEARDPSAAGGGDADDRWMPRVSGAGREVLPALVRRNIMVINSPLVRRGLVEAVGPFDVGLPPAEDWDYWLRCAFAGARFQYAGLEGTLALVRTHPTSSSQNRARMFRVMLKAREKLKGMTADEELLALNREMSTMDVGNLAVEEWALGNRLGGLSHFITAVKTERRLRWRLKWAACALASPFISGESLRRMVTYSFAEPLRQLMGKNAST